MSGSTYKVDYTGYAKAQIASLGAKAKPLGFRQSLIVDLTSLVTRLENDPLNSMVLKFPQQNHPCTECLMFFKYFSVRYLVYELQNVVEILEINVVPGHPLT
jgi:hypothetical protein